MLYMSTKTRPTLHLSAGWSINCAMGKMAAFVMLGVLLEKSTILRRYSELTTRVTMQIAVTNG